MKAAAIKLGTFLWLVLWLSCCSTAAAEIVRVQNPQALPVVDNAHILTPAQVSDLNVRLRTLADTDGTQVAVLTVPTTGDEDDFTFAQRTATEWGIGQKNNNNGALFLIAVNDRKSRIQVGYGLEGRLTDAMSKRILSTIVSPEFKQGKYYEGISRGVDAIISVVKGEYKAPPAASRSSDVIFYIIIILLILLFLWGARRSGRGGRGGHGGGGGPIFLPNIWTTGGGSSGGWGHSGGDFGGGGGGFGGGFGGGSFGGGGAGDSW